VRAGTYPKKPNLPYTPGSDLAGVVEGTGERVYAHGVAPGSGAYAELAVADRSQGHPPPEHVSFAQAAPNGVPYATAWRAIFLKAQARAAETILVHGASGGVGIAAVQLARCHGLQVIGTAGTDRGLALVREQGAHHVLNHRQPDYLEQVAAVTGGRGADVIIEMLANVNLDRDLDVLALRGRVVVVGNRGRIEIDPRKLMSKDGAIHGMTGFNITPAEYRESWAWVHLMLRGPTEGKFALLAYLQQLRSTATPGPLQPRLTAAVPGLTDALDMHLGQLARTQTAKRNGE
jgi:NADPH2:quinone reductase